MIETRRNFIYPDIKPQDFRFGSNQFIDVALREDGDWRNYLTPTELQRRNGIESSACYIEASQHAIAVIQEEQYTVLDQNYSARFNTQLSGATPYGGDPLKGAESMRNDGLIDDSMLPFNDHINSFAEFNSFKNSNEYECRLLGKDFLKNWKLNYDIVFERSDTLNAKYYKLKQALKYSPCPISVYGQTDFVGDYVQKIEGMQDTHLTLATYVDEQNRIHIRDTYEPFDKILPVNYNPDFCMRWSVSKIESLKKKYSLKSLWAWFLKEKLIYRAFKLFWINKK